MATSEETLQVLLANHTRFLRFLEPRVGKDAAEDVLQAAFVKGLTKADDLREDESAVAWFFRLLRNAVIDHRRRKGAEQRRLDVRAQGLAEGTTDDDALRATVCECVGELIPLLKPEYAAVLRRAELEGASLQDVGRELGITANNAGVRLHRARAALKKQLEAACGTCTEHGCLECTCHDG
jgi:RNA polymerase sigma factor (sigma-70 family)